MSNWFLKTIKWGSDLYLGLAAMFALLYLVVFVPMATVMGVMDTFKLAHFDEHRLDDGWTWALALTIFLLVLKTSREVEEIKTKLDQAEN